MRDFAKRPAVEREQVFRETAAKRGQKPGVIEKDFWVCWILGLLYEDDYLGSHIKFKGGTSLSKGYGLIERFSEDIDLLIDSEELIDEPLISGRTPNQQARFNKKLRKAGQKYLEETFEPKLDQMMGGLCDAVIVPDTTNEIRVEYPRAFDEESLLPYILLEIGPMGATTPSEQREIIPYSAEEYPELFEQAVVKVNTIKAERTFWEKITILHSNAHSPIDRKTQDRPSRHYYDVHQMHINGLSAKAIKEIELMRNVMQFKQLIYPQKWASDDDLLPGSFSLVPPEHMMKDLLADYAEMDEMFFYDAPDWEEIMTSVADIEVKINNL